MMAGCTDNPEAKAAKQMRDQTTQAVQSSLTQKGEDKIEVYDAAQQKVAASLQQNRSQGLTKDAALLASGNLALIKARQMQAGLDPLIFQIRASTNKLDKMLRDSEALLLEKDRIEIRLGMGEQERSELQALLTGDDSSPGLNQQLQEMDAQRQDLVSQKESLQADRDQVQAVLDQHQTDADALLQDAELARGDRRLDLERQAFDILAQRKDHYVSAQSLENEIAVLDAEIQLVQLQVDGLSQSIQEVQQQIESIDSAVLDQQRREIEGRVSENRQLLSSASTEIANALTTYRKACEEIDAVHEEAMAELEEIRSGDADFAATVRLADAAYHTASAQSAFVYTLKDLQERLQGLLDTADPVLASEIRSQLPMQQDTMTQKKAFESFDKSIEAYQKAASQAGRLGTDARCSILKSHLLALYGKMQLADLNEMFGRADETEAAMNELIQEGEELGTCFTQSETKRLIDNRGLDYLPALPLNMEVFLDEKTRELSEWKGLPISEQEIAVDDNIQQIDKLIAQYGDQVAGQLEPLKQEMLDAKERGFKESEPVERAETSGGFPGGLPGTSPGEPNGMF
jgi:hypothetical protein